MDSLLVINAGSSSLKFQIFEIDGAHLKRRVRGQIDGIGVRPRLQATDGSGASLADRTYDRQQIADLPTAIAEMRGWLRTLADFRLAAVGHRVVHGGPDHVRPMRIDAALLERLTGYSDLAPLHQSNNLAPIRLVMETDPDLPQVACFDTAFHRSHPPVADFYALPRSLHDEGVRRYGFHGLSYEFVAERLRETAPDIADGRVIVAHLGSGVSMCAMRGGVSIESTMGFTPLDGLPMGTRPGEIDPGVLLHLMTAKGMDAAAISTLLYRDAGLKGLSGISNDMRDLLASDDPRAAFAIEYFVHRAGMHAGALAAALGGLDAFVFTAGIGENAPAIRSRIAGKLSWLGAELDAAANSAGRARISTASSRVALYVIPTDEELMIARHTLALLRRPSGS